MRYDKKRFVIAVTGASGAVYASTLINNLYFLKDQVEEVSLIFSENARKVWELELPGSSITDLPFPVYDNSDFFAPFASGSYQADVMIVCPCSMGTLGRIANGISGDLISRSADVFLKEKRTLITVIREAPYNLIHIENMQKLTQAGGIVFPASPSFYSMPVDILQLVKTVCDRVLTLSGLSIDTYVWGKE